MKMTMTNAVRVLLPIVMICILEIYRGHTEHTLWIRVNHLVQPHRHFTYTLLHSHHLPYTPIHLTFLFPLHTLRHEAHVLQEGTRRVFQGRYHPRYRLGCRSPRVSPPLISIHSHHMQNHTPSSEGTRVAQGLDRRLPQQFQRSQNGFQGISSCPFIPFIDRQEYLQTTHRPRNEARVPPHPFRSLTESPNTPPSET